MARARAFGRVFLLACAFVIQTIPGFFPQDGRVAVWSYIGSGIAFSALTFSIAAGLLVALLRYRLYDAEAAISRSASVAILTLAFGAVFAGSAKGLEITFETFFGADTGLLPGVLAAVLATVIVTPAQSRIQSWASNRFQKELAHLRRDLPDCVNDLREVADLEDLLDEVLERVGAGVRSAQAAVVVGEEVAATRGVGASEARAWIEARGPFERLERCERDDPLFPLRVPLAAAHHGGAPEGWLLLGLRPDGSFYRRDEQEALAEIADPVARAIHVVATRQARDRRESEERRSMMAFLSDLAARVERLETGKAISASPAPGTSPPSP